MQKGLMQLLAFVNAVKRPFTELTGKFGADCQQLPLVIPAPNRLCCVSLGGRARSGV